MTLREAEIIRRTIDDLARQGIDGLTDRELALVAAIARTIAEATRP